MLVRVKQTNRAGWFGWFGNKRRYPGEEFEIAGEHELGSWMVAVDTPEVTAPKKRGRKPKHDVDAENGGESPPFLRLQDGS